MNLFPHFIARLGGAPYDLIQNLEVPELRTYIEQQLQLQTELKKVAEQFSEAVYGLISAQDDKKIQNKLLNLKRTIFNLKKVNEGDQNTAANFLDAASGELYNQYQEISLEIANLDLKTEHFFTDNMALVRAKLAETGGLASLQKGLLLSSQPLLNNIEDYRKQDLTRIRKKELKTEESLIKYLTRMTAKTSPFSTFTNLTTGSYGNFPAEMALHQDGDHAMTSHISLNNNLYLYLRGLMTRLPEIYRNFQLRLNPTLRLDGEIYVFLTNNNNVEAFQRVPYNPVVELFHDFLMEKTEGTTYGNMVNELIEGEYIDAGPEELEEYINQLINFGFIEFNIGVSGIDPYWDKTLIEVLSKLSDKSPLIPTIIEALKQTRAFAVKYAVADTRERRSLLEESHKTMRDMCMILHEAAGLPADERKPLEELQADAAKKAAEKKKEEEGAEKKEEKVENPEDEVFTHSHQTFFHFKPEQIFYEDTTSNIQPQANEEAMEKLLGEFKSVVFRMKDFDGFLEEQEKMQSFFNSKYSAEESVPLMKFYEDFFRDVKVPEAKQARDLKEKKEGAQPIPLARSTTERMEKNGEKMKMLTEMARTEFRGLEKVNLTGEMLDKFLPLEKHMNGSFGGFVQPFYEDGKLKLVANSYFPGYGKMFSRFLHIFPSLLTDDLRKYNAPDKDMIYIENVDASFFNANLHPPLMPYEIWMPGGQNTLPTDKQIPVTDIEVRFNSELNELELIHTPSGKRCYVFDLGFQGHRGRSQLFQLLSKFCPCKALMWQHITTTINTGIFEDIAKQQQEGPIVLPRIVYNDAIVLQRKRWVVRNEFIDKGEPNESEWQVFKRINKWRLALGIPDEVFVFLTNFGEMEGLDPELAKKLGRDGYKPQYINFNSPILVNLLEKMFDKVPVAMRLEEMLPGPSGMLKTQDGNTWVSEFVVQWYDQENANAATTMANEKSAVQ